MATLTISYGPTQTASPLVGRATQEEVPGFVETTIRVSAVAVALYYAALAIAAYPLLGTATAITTAVVVYSNISGIPVQDLIDRICDWCTPAQPMRRQARQLAVPSVPNPVQATATLTVPVSLVRRSTQDAANSQGESSIRSQSPERGNQPSTVFGRNSENEFIVIGRFPATRQGDIPSGLLDSQMFSSGSSGKKV